MALLDRCIFLAVSGGTGTFVEASAVTGYQTMEAARALDTNLYSYAAQSADLSQWEYGVGTYSLSGTSLARTTVLGNSLGGTSPINFTNPPQVMLTALVTDFNGFLPLNTSTTFFIRTAPSAVTFTTGTPGVVNWTSHGLSAGDPVVFSLPYNRQTCTISVASPAVVTSASGGFVNGDCVSFGEVGTLPTGVLSNAPADPGGQIYFVINQSGSTFNISATSGGSAINTSGSTSGTIYVSRTNPFGSANGGILNTSGDVIEGQVYFVLAFGLTANSFEISSTPGGSAINFGSTFAPSIVAQTGNDNNNGSATTRTGAFLTVGGALKYIFGNINFNAQDVTVQCADGTYYGGAFGGNEDGSDGSNVLRTGEPGAPATAVGGGSILFQGNTGNFDAVVWRSQSDVVLWESSAGLVLQFNALRTETDGGNDGLSFDGYCADQSWSAGNIHFAGGVMFGGGVDVHVLVGPSNGLLNSTTSSQILADANTCFAGTGDGLQNNENLLVRFNSTVTFIGTRTFISVLGPGADSSFATWAGPTPNAYKALVTSGYSQVGFQGGTGTDVPASLPVLLKPEAATGLAKPAGFSRTNFSGVISNITSIAGALCDPLADHQSLSSGFTFTIPDTDGEVIIDGSGTLATGTVNMPANPQPGQKITVRANQTITALTISANTNQTLGNGAPTTLAQGTSFQAIFIASSVTTNPFTGKWYFTAGPVVTAAGNIETESGTSPIKISAFSTASNPLGPSNTGVGDLVTGLQGGANVNFTQAELLSSKAAVAASGGHGGNIAGTAGAGDGAGAGGYFHFTGGHGGATGAGGAIHLSAGAGGSTSGNGGYFSMFGGQAANGTGGIVSIVAGPSYNGDGGGTTIFGGGAYGALGHTGGLVKIVGGYGGYFGTYYNNGGATHIYGGGGLVGGEVKIKSGASSGGVGADININSGVGSGTNDGGSLHLYSGNSGASGGIGGAIGIRAGNGYGTRGGSFFMYGGEGKGASSYGGQFFATGGASVNSYGGTCTLEGGFAYAAGQRGGHVYLTAGGGLGAGGIGGDVNISPGTGTTKGKLNILNAISTPGTSLGTLTNAPASGNPQTWLAVTINGVDHFIPAWHA